MNKLTKEQSQWLIKHLSTQSGQLSKDELYDPMKCIHWVDKDRIERIVNQCTEKEFPEFEIDGGNQGVRVYEGNGTVIIAVEKENECVLDIKEFLQFAEDVATIKEWLDDNPKV